MGNRALIHDPRRVETTYYSDITDNLGINPCTGQLALAINEQDIANSLRRLCLYGKTEREYEVIGGRIKKMLFEPVDSLTAIAIKALIENAVPVIYEKLGRYQVPVLLLWGDKDRTLPLKQSESILKLLPKTEFHVIENCGHIPHFEVPELVNRILVEFLASK